jgi:hypothetical protein
LYQLVHDDDRGDTHRGLAKIGLREHNWYTAIADAFTLHGRDVTRLAPQQLGNLVWYSPPSHYSSLPSSLSLFTLQLVFWVAM